MREESKAFLWKLLETASPSGFEVEAAKVWQAEAETFADEVQTDTNGNVFARLKGDGPRVMIEGHIDEIGVMITHIDERGFLWFSAIGGWDDQVLVGQRIRLAGKQGPVIGVIGKKPIHQMDAADREKVSKIKTLWIDIGAADAADAGAKVRVGDYGVIEQPIVQLTPDLFAGRGLDERIGAWVALESLRYLAEGERPAADVWAVAPVQEEIGLHGAQVSAFHLDPTVAIAIDVTHATDHPEADVRGVGSCKLGGGPMLGRGASISTRVHDLLVEAAEAEGIPYGVEATPRYTGTDADSMAYVRGGIPTGLVSIPNRYMHSPNETASLTDMDNCARLIAAFTRRLGPNPDLLRRR
ncbi:MAG: endoglucanase [Chloroflexi bacterium]|nr:MAG: endoglucanase [Chloroflexota bacterium]